MDMHPITYSAIIAVSAPTIVIMVKAATVRMNISNTNANNIFVKSPFEISFKFLHNNICKLRGKKERVLVRTPSPDCKMLNRKSAMCVPCRKMQYRS